MKGKEPEWVRQIEKNYFPHSLASVFHDVLDHVRYEGAKMIGEPYNISMKGLERFIKFCHEHGLTFYITGLPFPSKKKEYLGGKWHEDTFRVVVEKEKRRAR